MTDDFRLPIETLRGVKQLEPNIVSDIELTEKNGGKSMYRHLFRYSNDYGKNMGEKWNKVWTDDVRYLKDTKRMLKVYDGTTSSVVCDKWEELKSNKHFVEKYYYIDWELFKPLNNYSMVHQWLSVYRLISPVCTLVLPIVIMLSSWFIIRLSGLKMDFSTFIGFLTKYIKTNTSMGRLAENFSTASSASKCYALFSVIMYFVQIYNNVMVVINFNKNLGEMHEYINRIREYMTETSANMRYYSELVSKYASYSAFNCELCENCEKLDAMIASIKDVPRIHKSMNGFYNVGYVQKIIYQFYMDDELTRVMNYSIGFNGYIDNLNGVKENLRSGNISYAKFNVKKSTSFKDAYYPPLADDVDAGKIVKNSYKLNKEMLISGPNASGKTTVLKTTLFNIICSQQLGVGFYSDANIKVYSNLFCYINIPDTSGRDSLFQAEARRCVEILNKVSLCPKENTFCIFDELYSGTNHYEAISSAYCFLRYLINHHNFHFMMTTHFIDLCKKFEKTDAEIGNMKMCVAESEGEDDDFIYSYRMGTGISDVKGGVKVLKDLEYPDEIIANTKRFLETEF
jgi:hypothetical protein